MVVSKPVAGDQLYVAAPLAEIVAEPPLQIVAEPGVTLTVGNVLTVTVTLAVFWQPLADVPVTVYVVVLAGLACTVAALVASKPVGGDQLYVAAPLAVSVAEPPLQIVAEPGATLTIGDELTATVTLAVLWQPLADVPVTV
jgi:carbohydrate-selective porin OprB